MEWEEWLCLNRQCTGRSWLVSPDEDVPDIWWMTGGPDESAWVIASVDPVCPQCGATLTTVLRLEGGFGAIELEEGPVFDFLRSL